MSRKKKAREDCLMCHKSLPIGCGVHRLYCAECQKQRRSSYYTDVRKGKQEPKQKQCLICKSKFLPAERSDRLCTNCMQDFIKRRNNLHCLFCGKHLQPNGRLKFFCNTECSQPSWYVLRRMDPHYKRGESA